MVHQVVGLGRVDTHAPNSLRIERSDQGRASDRTSETPDVPVSGSSANTRCDPDGLTASLLIFNGLQKRVPFRNCAVEISDKLIDVRFDRRLLSGERPNRFRIEVML